MKKCWVLDDSSRMTCSIPDDPDLTESQREQECRKCWAMKLVTEQHQEDVM